MIGRGAHDKLRDLEVESRAQGTAEPVRAAIYVRCIGGTEISEGQLSALRNHANAAGWQVVGEYLDPIEPAQGSEPLPAWRALLSAVPGRRFDIILVTSLDGAFRSLAHMNETLGVLAAYGVGFQSLAEDFDTRQPVSRYVLAVLSSVARFESESRSQRIRVGMTHARSEGRHVGRPPIISRPEIQRMWPNVGARLETGEISVAEAARLMGISKTTVRRLLSRSEGLPSGKLRSGAPRR